MLSRLGGVGTVSSRLLSGRSSSNLTSDWVRSQRLSSICVVDLKKSNNSGNFSLTSPEWFGQATVQPLLHDHLLNKICLIHRTFNYLDVAKPIRMPDKASKSWTSTKINGETSDSVCDNDTSVHCVKRTYQPSWVKRKRTHGFLHRLGSKGGRRVIQRRLAKGRKYMAV